MKEGTIADGRQVRIFRMSEWSGLRDDDKIASLDLDEKIYVRDGILHVFSDREHDKPSEEFTPAKAT